MSMTLSFAHQLLSMGQNYLQNGRTAEAFAILTRLSRCRDLPTEVAEEAHACLGEIQIQRRDFKKARKHLHTALTHQPRSSRYHFLMARAIRSRRDEQLEKAAKHYKRSLEINPHQPECLAAYGQHLVRRGHVEKGLKSLKKAWELSKNDPRYLARLIKGLRLTGRLDQAREELRAAMFHNPQDRRFKKLWTDFRYYETRKQIAQNQQSHNEPSDPVILPFVRMTVRSESAGTPDKEIRYDEPATLTGPHRPMRSPDQRHVQ